MRDEDRNKGYEKCSFGVVYNPKYEKNGNNVPTDLTRRYYAYLPETFPTGL
jgi:hypothetical protein